MWDLVVLLEFSMIHPYLDIVHITESPAVPIVDMYVYVYVYMYMYICMYMYIYVHIHLYIPVFPLCRINGPSKDMLYICT